MQKLGSVVVLLAVVLGVGAAALPAIVHALDRGAETVTVEQLASGYQPKTRNLTVQGFLDVEHIVEKTVKDDTDHVKERRSFLPLVPRGWRIEQPVAVIYSTKAWSGYRLEALKAKPGHEGVLRNVLWERVESGVRDHFRDMGLRLADPLLLVEEPAPAG